MEIELIKQKILELAIKGELVPQDPNDEPADVLIEKIKEEKAKLIKEGKIKPLTNESYIFKGSDNCYYEKIENKVVDISNEIPFKIPDNWVWVRLKTIGIIIGGGTPSTSIKEYWDNGDIVWVTPAYMSSLTSIYIDNSFKKITRLGLNKCSAKLMPKGSIIMSSRAPIGYIGINTVEACTSQGCKSLVPFIFKMNHYLYFAIKASISRIIEASKGTTFDEISSTKFSETLVPLPPLEEQYKICNRINLLYKSVEEIGHNFQSIAEDAKILKRKILNSFFSTNSSYKSYYGNRHVEKLRNIIPTNKVGDGDWILSENMDNDGEYSLVQLKHIGTGNFLQKRFKHINKVFFKSNSCTEIKENYILINRLISDRMNVCLLPKLPFKCITAVDICWIAPSEEYNQKYLLYYFMSPEFQKKVQHLSSGMTRKRISKTNLLNISINIHELDEQAKIVNQIDDLFAMIDKIIS